VARRARLQHAAVLLARVLLLPRAQEKPRADGWVSSGGRVNETPLDQPAWRCSHTTAGTAPQDPSVTSPVAVTIMQLADKPRG
jgi:hypothetical protein